jgi:sortase A
MSIGEGVTMRRLQAALLLVSGLAAAWVAHAHLSARVYRETHEERFVEAPASPAADITSAAVGPDGIVGMLEIPRLELSEIIRSGDDDNTLDVAIGHLADTPLPWQVGNTVLAAHRDTHFRELRHIETGDVIRLRTAAGVFEYVVRDRMIVNPEDVWVLAPSSQRRLTLVTCYPFSYIGPAPQRFVVRADAR